MKAICPKCNTSIASNYLNRSKGVAYCNHCSDYFILDDHLKRIPYHIRREKKFTNISKPSKTKIDIKDSPQGILINFPNRLSLIVRGFLLIFLAIIIFGIYQTISIAEIFNAEFYLKIGILIIFSVLLFLSIVLKGPKTTLTISKDIIQLNQKRYFLRPYHATRKTENLDTIDVYYDTDHESGDSSGIEMNFDNNASLRIGQHLGINEQNWLAGQLIQIRDDLMLDQKVTKELKASLSRAKKNPIIVNTIRPKKSSIQSLDKSNFFTLIIPKNRKIGHALSTLILYLIGVSIFGTVTIGFWGLLPPFEYHKILKYVFAVFTLVPVYGLFYYLYSFIYRAEHKVFIGPTEIRIKLQPFGIIHEKIRPINALTNITSSQERNCILLKFKGHRDLRVGFSLTKDEIAFIIGELKKSVEKVNNRTASDK